MFLKKIEKATQDYITTHKGKKRNLTDDDSDVDEVCL